MEQPVFTVSEANGLIKAMLDRAPMLQQIFVRGEISNYKRYPSGYHYFTLKDPEGQLAAVLFADAVRELRFEPKDGMKVIAFGRISVYPKRGEYRMVCRRLSAEGLGDLHVAFEQLKAKLGAEGLFAPEHKKPLPRYPARIAIVTSSAGAAVHDMIRILGARWPQSKVILLPVRVQGAEAPAEIAGALRYVNRFDIADVVITGRGGGSIEDLWAFNDERVARAIYESRIPVISAVGHEPDVTIADYVADRRAATPSNAAEIAVPDGKELLARLGVLRGRLETAEAALLSRQRARLAELSQKRVLLDPMAFVADRRMQLDYIQARLAAVARGSLAQRQRRYAELCAALDALSPLKVLARGYAVVRTADGGLVRSAADVTVGERVDVALGRGRLGCTVTEREEGGENDGKDV